MSQPTVPNMAEQQLSLSTSSDEKVRSQDIESSVGSGSRVKLTDEEEATHIGVAKISALYLVFGKGWKIWLLYASIGLICYCTSLAANTTYTFYAFSTSAFGSHSLLGAITTATSVVAVVARPFIAKLSDITSRPIAYTVSLICYVLGLVLMAASKNINTIAAGQIIISIGSAGLDMVTTIILGDLTPLQWRGLAQSLSGSPYIINGFVAGLVTDNFGVGGWRWGYGMFAIALPAAITPALVILFWSDLKAKQVGALSLASSSIARRAALHEEKSQSFVARAVHFFRVIDGFGLILFGTGWSLILLPFTLFATATGGWSNASIIAMEVVGWIIFFAFCVWEWRYTSHALMPRRIFNRTFVACVSIDWLVFFTTTMQSLYYPSWVYVVRNEWSLRNYTFFVNGGSVALCAFGVLAGLVQRYTQGYKYPQIAGVAVRVIGFGLIYYATGSKATTGALVAALVITNLGEAFLTVASSVAVQASVPHQDLATVLALLNLFAGIGGSIGNAVASAVWTSQMPKNLKFRLNGLLTPDDITLIFGSIVYAKDQTDEVRAGVLEAYDATVKHNLYLPALIISVFTLVPAFFCANYHLGKQHNMIESKEVIIVNDSEIDLAEVERKAREAEAMALAAKQNTH